jgi:branched-chain amino acid aminotransferase
MVLHDRGFVLGDGLFETLVLRDGLPVMWREHIGRLMRTAGVLHFPLRDDFERDARTATEAVVELSDRGPRDRGTLRITLTRGSGTSYGLDAPEDFSPTLMVRLTAATRRSRRPADRETAWIVDQPRIDPANLLSGHKTTSSMWRVLAHETARSRGADLALMKTIDGDVGEADTACLFIVRNGEVLTPPLDRGILPSTTREFIVAQLGAEGRPWREQRLLPHDLGGADEVILSSSVTGIRPLRAVDAQLLPEATPVAEWLDERYEALAGRF